MIGFTHETVSDVIIATYLKKLLEERFKDRLSDLKKRTQMYLYGKLRSNKNFTKEYRVHIRWEPVIYVSKKVIYETK